MKKLCSVLLCVALLLSLCPCGLADSGGDDGALVFSEQFLCHEDNSLTLELFPRSSFFRVYNPLLVSEGQYREDGSRISLEGNGPVLRFTRQGSSLILESGELSGAKGPVSPGAEFILLGSSHIQGGDYISDEDSTRRMTVDLDAMSYSLDGSVGQLEFRGTSLCFTGEGGAFEMYPVSEAGWQGLRNNNSFSAPPAAALPDGPVVTMYLYGYDPNSGVPGPRPDVVYVSAPSELENISERSYRWRFSQGSSFYYTDLLLYPDYCQLSSAPGAGYGEAAADSYQDDYYCGSYTVDGEGRITIDTGTEILSFVPDGSNGLILESGSITSASSNFGTLLPPEETTYTEIEAGALFTLDYALGSSGEAAAPTTATAPTTAMPDFVFIAPQPAADGQLSSLVFEEQFSYHYTDPSTGRTYISALLLYPQSSYFHLSTGNFFYDGEYTETDGALCLSISGEELRLSRSIKNRLAYESGPLMAVAEISVENADGVSSHSEWLDEFIQPQPGESLGLTYSTVLCDGVYVLGSQQLGPHINDVLLDIDLSGRSFTLRGYDGSLMKGLLLFEKNCLVCEGEKDRIHLTPYSFDTPILNTYSNYTDQYLYYPASSDGQLPELQLDREWGEKISGAEDAVSLNDLKMPIYESYRIYSPRLDPSESGYGGLYRMDIIHDAAAGTWEFSNLHEGYSRSQLVQAQENADGSIVFSLDGRQWRFHRDKGRLIYDGGDPIVLGDPEFMDIWLVSGQEYASLSPGAVFDCDMYSCLYDTVYIIPSDSEPCGYLTALHFNFETGRFVLNHRDEITLGGSFRYDQGLILDFSFKFNDIPRFRTERLYISSGGALTGASDFMTPAGFVEYIYGNEPQYPDISFIPVPVTEALLEALPIGSPS